MVANNECGSSKQQNSGYKDTTSRVIGRESTVVDVLMEADGEGV